MTIPIMDDEYERVPGLFRAWDFGMLLEEGGSYRVEDGGRTDDGLPLFMVFHRPRAQCQGDYQHG